MDTKLTIYSARVKTFETLVQTIINLSLRTSSKQVNTWEEDIGLGIFGRICTISFSLLKLVPESETYKKNHTLDLWDYSSICILTRTLLDSYLIFYHYCIDIPADVYERTFKHQFWNYYIDYKKIKMLDVIRARYSDLQRKTLLTFIQNIKVHSQFRESMRSHKKDGLHYSKDSVIFWQNSIRKILT